VVRVRERGVLSPHEPLEPPTAPGAMDGAIKVQYSWPLGGPFPVLSPLTVSSQHALAQAGCGKLKPESQESLDRNAELFKSRQAAEMLSSWMIASAVRSLDASGPTNAAWYVAKYHPRPF
jgi:hypothetical protein